MLATIAKDFTFSASHRLIGLAADHPCSRLHGHNYTVRLQITGEVDAIGFVVDYRQLAAFKDYLDNELDHQHLNDVLPRINPTAENLSAHLRSKAFAVLLGLDGFEFTDSTTVSVSVSETPKTWATAL